MVSLPYQYPVSRSSPLADCDVEKLEDVASCGISDEDMRRKRLFPMRMGLKIPKHDARVSLKEFLVVCGRSQVFSAFNFSID